MRQAEVDRGGRTVTITHPGRGHTDHDLIVVVAGPDPTVVFCGDLVEESGDPVIDRDSDRAAWPATLGRSSMPADPMQRLFPGTARSSTPPTSSASDGG